MFEENAPSLLFDNANIQPLFYLPKEFLFILSENGKKFCFWFKR